MIFALEENDATQKDFFIPSLFPPHATENPFLPWFIAYLLFRILKTICDKLEKSPMLVCVKVFITIWIYVRACLVNANYTCLTDAHKQNRNEGWVSKNMCNKYQRGSWELACRRRSLKLMLFIARHLFSGLLSLLQLRTWKRRLRS